MIVHTKGSEEGPYFYGTMSDVMSQLDDHFIRCHNSYIVNLQYISVLSKKTLTIEKHKIPISRQYTKAVKTAFTGVE